MEKKNHFDNAAKSWDTVETIRRNEAFASAIKSCLKAGIKNVMDFGCGTGLLASHFSEGADLVLGIETSSGMLEAFNERFKTNHKVTSVAVNLEEAPMPSHVGKFDLIMSAMAFHHLKKPETILSIFKKQLNPGGQVFLIDLAEEDGSFHPDNKEMGVHHFGFSKDIFASWAEQLEFKSFDYHKVYEIKKGDHIYKVGMGVFSLV